MRVFVPHGVRREKFQKFPLLHWLLCMLQACNKFESSTRREKASRCGCGGRLVLKALQGREDMHSPFDPVCISQALKGSILLSEQITYDL